MKLGGIEICCPACRGDLVEHGGAPSWLVCTSCERRFPVVAGIPDLRLGSDPYIEPEADRAKGAKLAEHLSDLSFEEMVHYYYSITDVVPPVHAKQYTQGLLAGVARAEGAIADWKRMGVTRLGPALLDVGCGTAPLLVAASRDVERLIGIDVAFRWLVVGKKRLMEAGLEIPLICASADALPFRDQVFDTVTADSVLEHLEDQERSLSECSRVLKSGGWYCVTTPNRTSLGPDPHTGLWAGSILPSKLTAAYVRKIGGIPPRRKLLSAWSLRSLLSAAGFRTRRIALPEVPAAQRAFLGRVQRLGVDIYGIAKRVPVLRSALFLVGPFLRAVARK